MNKVSISKKSKQLNLLNYIFVLLLFFVVVVIIWSNTTTSTQDDEWLNDYSLLQQLTDPQSTENAEGMIGQLEILQKKYPSEYMLAYQLGLAYLNAGNMKQASTMYGRTIDLNPYITENKEFMYQYAIILANDEQQDHAKNVVERAMQLPTDEEYQTRLASLLETIKQN